MFNSNLYRLPVQAGQVFSTRHSYLRAQHCAKFRFFPRDPCGQMETILQMQKLSVGIHLLLLLKYTQIGLT